MFARRFFGASFYAPTYFPGGSDAEPPQPEFSDEYWRFVIGGRLIGG